MMIRGRRFARKSAVSLPDRRGSYILTGYLRFLPKEPRLIRNVILPVQQMIDYIFVPQNLQNFASDSCPSLPQAGQASVLINLLLAR